MPLKRKVRSLIFYHNKTYPKTLKNPLAICDLEGQLCKASTLLIDLFRMVTECNYHINCYISPLQGHLHYLKCSHFRSTVDPC